MSALKLESLPSLKGDKFKASQDIVSQSREILQFNVCMVWVLS